jgi:hypothetical protein
VAVSIGGAELPAMADSGSRHRDCEPVSMGLHVHSSFSEGGSWADGGGGASMMAQLDQAVKSGVDVIWWTDHDWRMEAYGYYEGIAFDGTNEQGKLAWEVQNSGAVTGAAHEFVDEPHSPGEPGKALRVAATGPSSDWGVSYLWAHGGNSFYSTNVSDTTLEVDVLAEQVGPDAELVVQVETSYRPATAGRPAGLYILEYRVGNTPSRRLETPLTGVVTVAASSDWQTLRMVPLDDIAAFWPDLVAEDSGLARLRFGVRARGNAAAQGVFDHLRIIRTRDQVRWATRTQGELMRRLRKLYPTVTQLQSTEVSMVRHLNVFMTDFELYPYPSRGKAPTLDDSVEGIEKVVRWYHDRDALVQYNHPETSPEAISELVATRALGTDMMEIGDAGGGFTVIRDRIAMYDVAARNAIFLTATSQIDDHAGRDWLGQSHLYVTSTWAPSRSAADLIEAMASGQVWWQHQRLWPTAQLDLAVGGKRAMGRVIKTSADSVPVDVVVKNLPADGTVKVVVGVCDRKGDTTPSIVNHSYPASAFTHGSMRFELLRNGGSYLRVEVYDSAGVLLGFGNPLWVLPTEANVDIPKSRRLAVHAGHGGGGGH